MKRVVALIAAAFCVLSLYAAPKSYRVISPDKSLVFELSTGDRIQYSVYKNGDLVLAPSEIALKLGNGTVYGGKMTPKSVKTRSVDNSIDALFYKKAKLRDNFNESRFVFSSFDLVVRVYNAGAAYRFVSKSKKAFEVESETASFNFPGDWNMYVPYVNQHTETLESQFWNSFESLYTHTALSQWNKERLAFLPVMVESPLGYKINIMESDLLDYPGMYLYNGDGDCGLEARFAAVPDEVSQGGHNMLQGLVHTRKPYIAECSGATEFPWRILSVSDEDIEQADNDLVYLLGDPADPEADWSWVKPGKVAWEWWNDWNLVGVDFKTGVNNRTYKYYIDFASRNGIEYIILDEGWAVNKQADLFQVVPEIDLPELCRYAEERGVGIVLWAGYWAFNRDMDKVCEHYSKMGVKGWKIDFMDRDDQQMVQFYTRAAQTAAKYRQFVDFHGAYKPVGLNRTYPNVLNYEGVFGLENMKWAKNANQVPYDVTIPFIRMAAGPMDYTQGAMLNSHREHFKSNNSRPGSQGTRCHQLGEYIVFESPFNMLCDSPTNYEKEPECTGFISKVPTTWDETKVLQGKVAEYIVTARRKGDVWYIGGINNWTEREVELDLSFLGEGSWKVELFQDGVNVRKCAQDFLVTRSDAGKSLKVNMYKGGGFAARISR